MDKRELKVRVKEIINAIDESIETIEDSKSILDEAKEKLDDLEGYLDLNSIMPSYGFDSDEIFQNILEEYFENDDEITNIISDIESLRSDIEEHISEMSEGARREQWEELQYELSSIEDILDI